MLSGPQVAVTAKIWYSLMCKTDGDAYRRALGEVATSLPSGVPGLQQSVAGAQVIHAVLFLAAIHIKKRLALREGEAKP